MEAPPYQYQPLQHEDSIRILILHPSPNESDPIACTICHENLSDGSLLYEAVSYTWGNSGLTHVIHCNDAKQRLSVGKNCHAALRRLRLPDKRRNLWIDAVCINQEDLSERGHQVRMMKEVYDCASGVMVMLNDEVPECRLLLGELEEASNLVHERARAGSDLNLWRDAYPVRSPPSKAIVRELETLFEDPWFTRAWVLQEVHEKGPVTIVYGSATIPFEALMAVELGYSGFPVTRTALPLPLRLILEGLDLYTTSQFSLWNRLYWSRECLATDPRDNVFALKSLLGSRQAEVDHLIDYAQSVEECFKRVAVFLLPVLALRILAATRHPHRLKMASWIPDWSQTLPLQFGAFEFETFGREVDDDVFSPTNVEIQKRALLSYLYSDPYSDSYSDPYSDSYSDPYSGPALHVTGCKYAKIVECSQTLRFVSMDDLERQMRQMYNQFKNLRLHLNEESKIYDIETPSPFSGRIFGAMSLMDGFHLHGNLRRWGGAIYHVNNKPVIDLQDEWSDLYGALQECSVALMENGGLVIVPGTARNGDAVCIIAGAIAPCLLRRHEDGCWILISGDCHIFGDDLSNIAVSDAYVDSHRSQAEEFILR